MDIFKPLHDFFHGAGAYIAQCFDENDHKPAQPVTVMPTQFESMLERCLNQHRGLADYRAVRVLIIDTKTGGIPYTDPITGERKQGIYDIAPIAASKPLARMIKEHEDFGHRVVMLLDLHGGSLQEQIPGWKHGRMNFPDMFLNNPRITVDIDQAGITLPQLFAQTESNVHVMKPAYRRTKDGERLSAPSYFKGIIVNGP